MKLIMSRIFAKSFAEAVQLIGEKQYNINGKLNIISLYDKATGEEIGWYEYYILEEKTNEN